MRIAQQGAWGLEEVGFLFVGHSIERILVGKTQGGGGCCFGVGCDCATAMADGADGRRDARDGGANENADFEVAASAARTARKRARAILCETTY